MIHFTTSKNFPLFLSLHLLFVFVVFGNEAFSQGIELLKKPLRVHFSPGQYQGGIQNWDFDQDGDGILYVANNDGLLIFDGDSWELLSVPASTKVRAVLCDGNRVYVGGQGQIGYFERDQSDWVFVSLLRSSVDTFSVSETWDVLKIEDEIFFSTLEKLFCFSNDSLRLNQLPATPNRVHSIGGGLYIQLQGEGLMDLTSENRRVMPIRGSSAEFIGSAQAAVGIVFFGQDGSVFVLDEDEVVPLDNAITQGSIVNAVLQLHNGDIALGTQNKGLLIIDKQLSLKKRFTVDEGISNKTVTALHQDQFKNLWVGLHTGIDYLELNSPLSIVTEQIGFEGTGYAAAMWKNDLYLGTNNGLFIQKGERLNLIEGSEGQVYNLSFVGGSLILNHHTGAYEITGDRLKKLHGEGSWMFMETPVSGRYLAGSYDGIRIFEKKNERWSALGKVEGLAESSRVMEFENDSVLWMTHGYKGAYRIVFDRELKKTKSVKRYGMEDGFPSNTLINVYRIDGKLVFSGEHGFYSYDEDSDRFEPNQFLNGHFGMDHVSKLLGLPNGDIYFIQNRKLGRLAQRSLGSYEKQTQIFNRVNKYLSDDLENISFLGDQGVLVGTREGFIHFDPDVEFQYKDSFDVVFREVKVLSGGEQFSVQPAEFQGTRLNYKESFRVDYACPYFDGFEAIKYAYRILPINDQWSEWSSTSETDISYLRSGRYTFQVKAINVYGVESEVSSLNFSFSDPWYTSDFAIGIYCFVLLIGFSGFSLRQRKKHAEEKNEITKNSENIIREKVDLINEIEEKSQQELTALRNQKLRSEISHKNSQLSSVTTHLLQKNELIREIKKNIEHTIEQGATKQALKKVVKSIERNLSEDESWDQFAFHFDQVHGDFLKKLKQEYPDLTPQETKLAAYLRMNLTSKDVAQLLNISVRGVEISRYRLRKKLKLEREINLVSFLMDI